MKFFARDKSPRRPQRRVDGAHRRHLLGELLERRDLMTVDGPPVVTYPFHNENFAVDVNNDGRLTNLDALIVVQELRNGGSRSLVSTPSGEGEGGTVLFIDVNGDNKLTNLDAQIIVQALRGEGESNPLFQFGLHLLDTANNAIPANTLNVGQQFQLRASIQDVRQAPFEPGVTAATLGAFAAYLDVLFPASVVQSAGTLNFTQFGSVAFSQVAADHRGSISNATGLINDAGNNRDFFDLPYGGVQATLFRNTMTVVAAPALDATAAQNDAPSAQENSATITLNVLANDNLVGTASFTSNAADTDGLQLVSYAPQQEIDPNQPSQMGLVGFGSTDLKVRTTATITQVTGGSQGGMVQIAAGGQSLTYRPAPNFSGVETFQYTIRGANGGFSTATVSVTVGAVNDPPVARMDTPAPIKSNSGRMAINVLANDDANDAGDALAIVAVGGAAGGQVTTDGAMVYYTPTPGFVGLDSFTYRVRDNGGAEAEGAVNIVVNQVAPLVDIIVDVLDANGVPTPVIEVGQEFFIRVRVDDLRAEDIPTMPPNFFGVTSAYFDMLWDTAFMDVVLDGGNPFGVDVDFDSPDAVTMFGEQPVTYDSDPPVAGQASFIYDAMPDGMFDNVGSTQSDLGLVATPGSNAVELFRVRMLATAVIVDTPITTSPVGVALGLETTLAEPPQAVPDADIIFGQFLLTIATLSPNAPVGNPDAYTVNEDTTLTISMPGTLDGQSGAQLPLDSFGVLNNDTDLDPGTTLEAVLVGTTANGTLTLNDNGTFTYVPNMNFNGPDMFSYRVSDGGRLSAPVTVTINVVSVTDPPIAGNDNYNLLQNQTLVVPSLGNLSILANDTNIEPGTLMPMLVTGPANGVLVGPDATGGFTYTPNLDFFGVDSFTYKAVNTLDMGMSNVATVTLNVGLVPGDVGGQVFADVNFNNVLDTAGGENVERTIGGVTIHLQGFDLLGRPVDFMKDPVPDGDLTTVTDANGMFFFGDIFPGNYTIVEDHPPFLQDITPNSLSVSLRADQTLVNFKFPEQGLLPNFVVENDRALCSSSTVGFWSGIRNDGTQAWYVYDRGWNGFGPLTVILSPDRTAATIRVFNPLANGGLGQAYLAFVSTVGNPKFHFLGMDANGVVVRFDGAFADFPFQPVSGGANGEGEGSYAAAVDAVFGE